MAQITLVVAFKIGEYVPAGRMTTRNAQCVDICIVESVGSGFKDSYFLVRNSALTIVGCNSSPVGALGTTCVHYGCNPSRSTENDVSSCWTSTNYRYIER